MVRVGEDVRVWEGVKVAVGGGLVFVGEGVICVGEVVAVGSPTSVDTKVSRGGGSVLVGVALQAAVMNRNNIEIKNLADVGAGINIELAPPGVNNSCIIYQLLDKIRKSYLYSRFFNRPTL